VNFLKLTTPGKDGELVLDMDDEVQRGVAVTLDGNIMWPPPPVKVSAAPAAKAVEEAAEPEPEPQKSAFQKHWWKVLVGILAVALIVGAPPAMANHFIVFMLACVVGFYVITNVTHSLHTPLMSETNAISGIIIVGALLQIVFHGLAKNALLLSAGAMIYRTGRLECREYRGIGREMPVTLGCFALAALSLVGVPPCGGFYAKWFLALGAMEHGLGFGVAAASVLLASALLTALYLLPIVADGFFPGEGFAPREKEAPLAMRFSTLVFSLGVLVLGVFSAPLERILSAVVASLF
jgi:formate hydrogenlyase subunit 3/multisubunit Na+/H+ antiporter MnhD subunit